eukprot:gene29689-36777_t
MSENGSAVTDANSSSKASSSGGVVGVDGPKSVVGGLLTTTTVIKKRGRPPGIASPLNTKKSKSVVDGDHSEQMAMGPDLIATMSTTDSVPRSEDNLRAAKKSRLSGARDKDSDDEAEFEEGDPDDRHAAKERRTKKQADNRQSKGSSSKQTHSLLLATQQLPSDESMWSLNEHCIAVVTTTDPRLQLSSMKFLLKRFETGYPSIGGMLDNKLHEKLGEIVAESRDDELVQPTLMVLNNLLVRCKKPQLAKVLAVDLVPSLVGVMARSVNQDLYEHSIWVLDNLLAEGEGNKFRKQALREGVLDAVLNILTRQSGGPNKAVSEHVGNLLCTLSEGGDFRRSEYAEETHLLVQDASSEGGSHESGEVNEQTMHHHATVREILVDEVIPDRLVADCTEQLLATLLSLRLVEKLGQLLMDGKRDATICASACECLSNVCKTGGVQAIQAVIDEYLIMVLIELTTRDANETDDETAVYATYCILFAVQAADLAQTQHLVDQSCLPVVCGLLEVGGARGGNKDLVKEALRTIGILLRKFRYLSDFDHVSSIVESAGGWDSVARLRQGKDAAIRQLAIELDLDAMRAAYPASGPLRK